MADRILLNATKGKPKSLSICNKDLRNVPPIIGKITTLKTVDLKNNVLTDLPPEFSSLKQLESLNLGNNKLEVLPEVLAFLSGLQRLHLFNNKLSELNSVVFSGLQKLTFLNLNGNQLHTLPSEINRLVSLQFLSLDHNHLQSVPTEICHLINLTELHLADNQISSLPEDMAFLRNLTKLYVYKNFIEELPEGLSKCTQLRVLDVSANRLRIFPAELAHLPLKELYCEENNLLQHIPVHSQQEDEVLTLKEITARSVLKELRDGRSFVKRAIRHYPKVQEMLQYASECAVCGQSFLNTWLECVHFVDARKLVALGENHTSHDHSRIGHAQYNFCPERSCAQGQKQELFQCEAFCAPINVLTRKDMTTLASPMLGTLDGALYEDSLECGHCLSNQIGMLHSRPLDKFEAVLSGRHAGHAQSLIPNGKLRKNWPQSYTEFIR